MSRHILSTSICAALLATGGGLAAPSAGAAGACVDNHEYESVHRGMSKVRVHRIFGTSGQLNGGGPGLQIYTYDKCGRGAHSVLVEYQDDRNGVWRLARKQVT